MTYRIREDTRLSKTLLDHIRTYDMINMDECKKTETDLKVCLTGIIGEDDTRKLLTMDMDIHLYADVMDRMCTHLTDVLTCYKTSMTKKIECVREHGKEVDEELLTRGMTNMETILKDNCDDETKTNIKDASTKIKDMETHGCLGLTMCIREKIHGTRILYGTELTKMPYVDTTKCCTMNLYRDCMIKEWEKCDKDNVDGDMREKAHYGMTEVMKTIGCDGHDEHMDNMMDKRFFHLKQLEACRLSVTDEVSIYHCNSIFYFSSFEILV